jgi:hypothetical protein
MLGKALTADWCSYGGTTSKPLSSSGLGHRPFKAAARVRIPLGAPESRHGTCVGMNPAMASATVAGLSTGSTSWLPERRPAWHGEDRRRRAVAGGGTSHGSGEVTGHPRVTQCRPCEGFHVFGVQFASGDGAQSPVLMPAAIPTPGGADDQSRASACPGSELGGKAWGRPLSGRWQDMPVKAQR